MKFEKEYFTSQSFSKKELLNLNNAITKTFNIATTNKDPEVIFHFTYMALLKIGIYALAKRGYRIKSRPGHHIKILEALSNITQNEEIAIIGNNMRKNRNLDIYSFSAIITKEETLEYLIFVKKILKKITG